MWPSLRRAHPRASYLPQPARPQTEAGRQLAPPPKRFCRGGRAPQGATSGPPSKKRNRQPPESIRCYQSFVGPRVGDRTPAALQWRYDVLEPSDARCGGLQPIATDPNARASSPSHDFDVVCQSWKTSAQHAQETYCLLSIAIAR